MKQAIPAFELDPDVRVLGPTSAAGQEILSPEAIRFLGELVREFRPRVDEILALRGLRHLEYRCGVRPRFRRETAIIRETEWNVAPLPQDLQDRRVEITGPVERKMVINALNSWASCFMADFEDSNAPTWENCLEGQVNLRDAVSRTIEYTAPGTGKEYRLVDDPAVLLVRPRGWHLWEEHVEVDGRSVPAGLVDFGLYFFHNARRLIQGGSGPYFYLPKLESHIEARLWNDVFVHAQEALGVPQGTIKATVLIETLPAAFEMDEILYELREHSAGLNCGRWDYIFSYIKVMGADPDHIVPDRSQVGMTQPFMRAYTCLAIRTCHRRGVHAMGGMAAQIPIKGDPEANEAALEKVRQDKIREVQNGHDGTWVAHPALVPIARGIFDAYMPAANQIDLKKETDSCREGDLLLAPEGTRTDAGLRHNVRVGVLYLEAWLGGSGCVPLYNLMEDAATAEISRTQVWQWLKHRVDLEGGEPVTLDRVRRTLTEEMHVIRGEVGDERFESGRFEEAAELFLEVATSDPLIEFLTLPAYPRLVTKQEGSSAGGRPS